MRLARRSVHALLRSLRSKDLTLRVEATAALGRLGGPGELGVLEKLASTKDEDVNVRANAYVAIGRLGVSESARFLKTGLADNNPFIARCAEEGLRLLTAAKIPEDK